MTYDEHLKLFELTRYATIDEVKASFRKLALLYHPDHYNEGTDKFRLLKESYDWLINNHKPLLPKKDLTGYETFYRVLGDVRCDKVITLPLSNYLEEGVIIQCMFLSQEFRIVLEAGDSLPKKLKIMNMGDPFIIDIKGDGYVEY